MVRNVKIVEIIRTNIKPKIAIVSKTQIFSNLTSAERSGAQCEVGTALRRQACQRHALSDNQRVKGDRMSPTCYAWHAIASPQIAFGVIEIGSLREPAVGMWFTNPVETCHGASLRLCHPFSYPHLIFAAEKKNEHEQVCL